MKLWTSKRSNFSKKLRMSLAQSCPAKKFFLLLQNMDLNLTLYGLPNTRLVGDSMILPRFWLKLKKPLGRDLKPLATHLHSLFRRILVLMMKSSPNRTTVSTRWNVWWMVLWRGTFGLLSCLALPESARPRQDLYD